jgi:hypothetical protein
MLSSELSPMSDTAGHAFGLVVSGRVSFPLTAMLMMQLSTGPV